MLARDLGSVAAAALMASGANVPSIKEEDGGGGVGGAVNGGGGDDDGAERRLLLPAAAAEPSAAAERSYHSHRRPRPSSAGPAFPAPPGRARAYEFHPLEQRHSLGARAAGLLAAAGALGATGAAGGGASVATNTTVQHDGAVVGADGKPLGKLRADGMVVGPDGKVLGKRSPDGSIDRPSASELALAQLERCAGRPRSRPRRRVHRTFARLPRALGLGAEGVVGPDRVTAAPPRAHFTAGPNGSGTPPRPPRTPFRRLLRPLRGRPLPRARRRNLARRGLSLQKYASLPGSEADEEPFESRERLPFEDEATWKARLQVLDLKALNREIDRVRARKTPRRHHPTPNPNHDLGSRATASSSTAAAPARRPAPLVTAEPGLLTRGRPHRHLGRTRHRAYHRHRRAGQRGQAEEEGRSAPPARGRSADLVA